MGVRVWWSVLSAAVVVFGGLTCAEPVGVCVSASPVCPAVSSADSILGVPDSICPINWDESCQSIRSVDVMEGDEASLQRVLSLVNKKSHDYAALLFYASWCPFSASFRPMLSILSSLYPSIPHFAIEESVIRPSILSKYGVHGFPTLFLLNSTMRMRYHGSRTLGSLVAFYNDVAGLKTAAIDSTSLEELIRSSDNGEQNSNKQQSCPFSWARSPENLFRQETYLALASSFVLLRLLYLILPTLSSVAQLAWVRHIQNMTLRSLLDHPRTYLNGALQLFNYLKEPCKRSNLQEGAMNAKAWASKSLASVSFGETSTAHE